VNGSDPFSQAYAAGVVEEDTEPEPQPSRRRKPLRRGAVGTSFALGGCVLTPAGAHEDAYVVVGADGDIAALETRRPDVDVLVETEGVILPGLIDLHGHPDFNVFAPWEPPGAFANRYEWRASEIYRQLVREPQNRLLSALPPGTQARYAEVRALVGGVTAIQGASGRYPSKEEALVRNVDLRLFGEHRARSMIDLPDTPDEEQRLQRIVANIAAGEIDTFYIHLAEGRRDDEQSRREFDRLVELGALTAATVVIHGTALGREQFGAMADAGAKLVWSPQSNLRLYGETVDVAAVLDAGVPLAVGADWLPTGSASLLSELKVARRVMRRQGLAPTARQLVDLVTAGAAAAAGVADRLGTLAPGRPADVVVLERRHADPWENLVEADPSWVELVTIDADVAYGRSDWCRTLVGADRLDTYERVVAWGQDMALDTSYRAQPDRATPPTLSQLRADLIAHYPPVGPIFA
jgi:5-methylthioadenosine/S-adenosylhomocysteine deaminase